MMKKPSVSFCLALSAWFVLAGTALADARSPTASESVEGTWGAVRSFGPEVSGKLIVRHEGESWSAEVSGYRIDARFEDGVISFEVPGERGEFRGTFEATDGGAAGQWIQPGVVGMFGQRFSTPVRLERIDENTWLGEVTPLLDRVSVFLRIEPEEEGRRTAWIRNREVNFGRFFDFTDVVLESDRLELRGTLSWRKEEQPSTLLGAIVREDPETISLFVEDLGGTYDLQRIDSATSHFFPRPWARGAYAYHQPLDRHDGWKTADLEDVGMAPAPVEALIEKIISTPIEAIDSPYIDAVLVARHGKLVVEEYFHGWEPDQPHDTRSASKSITGLIVGSAVHSGYLTVDSPVYEVMYRGDLPSDLDPRAKRMTVEHLITMASGLACDDWDSESPGGEDRMQNQSEVPNWYQYILDLPMIHEPGEVIAYCSGGMSLAGGVVARASGMVLTDFFERYLGRPLQMGAYHTNLMPTGEAYAGGGLRVTGRDFLKFGQLLLDGGVWNGHRIVDEGWVRASLEPWHDLGYRRVEGYGYGWWLFEYELDRRKWSAFYAGGNGGNYIIGVPELDLVIVFLASNYNQNVMHQTKYDYVPEFILRSILEGELEKGVDGETQQLRQPGSGVRETLGPE